MEYASKIFEEGKTRRKAIGVVECFSKTFFEIN